jgi:hypothetical protein
MDITKNLEDVNKMIKQSYCEHKFSDLDLDTGEIDGILGLKSATCRNCNKVISADEFFNTYYKMSEDI